VLRKLMAGVVLCSVPVLSFGVAQIATSGTAGAAASTTCTGTPGAAAQGVTFAAPGLSNQGAASVSAKSTAKVSSGAITCTGGKPGTGTVLASKVKSTSTEMCTGSTAPPNPPSPCPAGEFVYDSVSQFLNGGATLNKSAKTTKWTDKGTTYVASNTSACSTTTSGCGTCPTGEGGFVLQGHLTMPASLSGKSTVVTACFEGDAGPNTTGTFVNDVASEAGGNTSIVITSGTFDPVSSSIVFA
jgi:hypothetical protein